LQNNLALSDTVREIRQMTAWLNDMFPRHRLVRQFKGKIAFTEPAPQSSKPFSTPNSSISA
jgi:hypothetical protein